MKRILALMSIALMFIMVMPIHAAPVESDVGYSFIQQMDETTSAQVMITDQSFMSVSNPGEWVYLSVNKAEGYVVTDSGKLYSTTSPVMTGNLMISYQLNQTGSIHTNSNSGYNIARSTSSGGLSY